MNDLFWKIILLSWDFHEIEALEKYAQECEKCRGW